MIHQICGGGDKANNSWISGSCCKLKQKRVSLLGRTLLFGLERCDTQRWLLLVSVEEEFLAEHRASNETADGTTFLWTVAKQFWLVILDQTSTNM